MSEKPLHACCCAAATPIDWPMTALLNLLRRKLKTKDTSMAQTITKSAKDLVRQALSAVPAFSVDEALSLVNGDSHVFVDLRDRTEQTKTGRIPGAVASSRGMMEFHIDPESPAHIPAFSQDKTYVFYCASGSRSALAAKVAIEMGLHPVVNLTGGVAAWKKVDGPMEQG
jgi:rhodanese-related sulfurtransferase